MLREDSVRLTSRRQEDVTGQKSGMQNGFGIFGTSVRESARTESLSIDQALELKKRMHTAS